MLLTMKELLDHANEGNYAIVAPNVFSETDARACLEVAEDERSPIILDVAVQHTSDLVFFGGYLTKLCEQAAVPVAVNLDHGATFEDAVRAIRAGFTSIMVDRSTLPYEENVAQVKELVHIAHSLGISVEAELGHVGSGFEYRSQRDAAMTVPAQAKDYIEATGVDCLAVAIGTAHGAYIGTPKLDFERLTTIKELVGIPLVLHGGSGTGDENIAKACRLGINKVNVCNELLESMLAEIQSSDLRGDRAYEFWNVVKDGLQKRVRQLIHVCGSDGKAWVPPHGGLPHVSASMRE